MRGEGSFEQDLYPFKKRSDEEGSAAHERERRMYSLPPAGITKERESEAEGAAGTSVWRGSEGEKERERE